MIQILKMLKKKIQIKGGKVHDVSYRLFLMNLAGKLEKKLKDLMQIT